MGRHDRFNWKTDQLSPPRKDACLEDAGGFERMENGAYGGPTGSDGHSARCPGTSVEAIRIADEICRIVRRNPEGARANALHLRTLLSQAETGSADVRGGLASWQERKIDRYLGEHLENPPTVKELAGQVSLSVSHFFRAFKQTFGVTPHQRVIWLRLELAQKLMLTTEMSLSEIALTCGLADQTHLSKLFRRWLDDTPNRWRRRNLTDVQVEARGMPRASAVYPSAR